MPKFDDIKTGFNSGELTPKLAVRGDIDQFRRGCKTASNVELLPQGGFSRRGGFKAIDEVANFEKFTDRNLFNFFSFEIAEDFIYQILFVWRTPSIIGMIIHKNGDFVQQIDYHTTLDSTFDVKKIDACQNVNNFIITHPDVPVKNLRLDDPNTDTFVLEEVNFIGTPQFAFFDDLSPDFETDIQDLRITLDNHTGDGNGITKDVTDPFRDFRVGFNGQQTGDITYCSPYNVGTLDTSNEKRNWVLRDQSDTSNISELFVTVNTSSFTFEFDFRMSHALSGFDISLGKFKRDDYATDQEFIDAITNEMHKKFVDTFSDTSLSNDATQYTMPIFRGLIQSGTFAGGDLIFRIFCQNATLNGDQYLTVSDWNLFTDNMDINLIGYLYDNGYANTIIQTYSEFSEFGFWKDFENNVKFGFPLTANLQAQVNEINALNGVYAPAFDIRFKISGTDSANYPKVSGVFSQPKKWEFEVTNITGIKQVNGYSGLEDAWSEVRGYPISCAFIENRLVFGGSKSLPNFLWASESGQFFSFRNTDNLADEAILNVSPTSNKLNDIRYVVGEKSLQLFTEGSEHYNPNALSPATISLPLQSKEGVAQIKPVIIDNATYFVDNEKKTLRRFLYDDAEQSYKAENVSILSSHLIKNPYNITAFKTGDSNFIVMANDDKTITVFQTIREQQISGYFSWSNDLIDFEEVVASGGKLYIIGSYLEGAERKYSIFVYDKTIALDYETQNSPIVFPQLPTFDNDDNLEVFSNIIRDDNGTKSVEKNKVLQSELLPDETFEGEDIYAGVDFLPTVETTSITVNFGTGEKMSRKKRINECYLHLDEATGWNLTYKGKKYIIDYRDDPLDPLSYPAMFTGDKRVKFMGYIERDTITITQDYAFNVGSVLGITISIKV